MATLSPATPWPVRRRLTVEVDLPACAAWASSFLLVAYLALRNGGYETVVRSELGIAVWWIVLLLAVIGLIPARLPAAAWVSIGLLGAFAAWTGIAAGWSRDAENTVVELGRLAAYLGFLVLAVALQGRTAIRHVVGGLASAIALVTVLAVLSRLHPQAFPVNDHFQFLSPASASKLSYPLGYWNALAAFTAIGIPLLVALAVCARTPAGRGLAAAMVPVSAVCLYLTVSRGGVIELGLGLAVFMVAFPRRLEALATLAVTAAGSAILAWATSHHHSVTQGLPTGTETHQGTELIALMVIVCAGVALLHGALMLGIRNFERPAVLSPSPRAAIRTGIALAVLAVAVAIVVGAPGALAHAWRDFKQVPSAVTPGSQSTVFTRLEVANGNGRYQLWQAAFHAFQTRPWLGIGPGTYKFWWAQHATIPGFVTNAHSLYFETLAETGIVGLALLGGAFAWFLATAVRRLLSAPPETRQWLAAVTGALVVFLVAAALEWIWQLAVIATVALTLGAAIVAGDVPVQAPAAVPRWVGLARRAAIAALAVGAIGAVLVPLTGTLAIQRSRAAAAAGNLRTAFADSLAAQRLQPYAATPRLQEALLLEAAGELGPAADAARAATIRGPTDSGNWLTLARIDARRGATTAALAELRRARELDPQSSLFGR